MTDPTRAEIEGIQNRLYYDGYNDGAGHSYHQEKYIRQATDQLIALVEKTEAAYGGCHKCYGKGYATVNERWHGHDTDQDIGSPGGYISGGKDFAMKYCTCERGQQLAALVERREREAVKAFARQVRDFYIFSEDGPGYDVWVDQYLAHQLNAKEPTGGD